MIYRCKKSEYALVMKRQLKSCHYIGSYCDQKLKLFNKCVVKKKSYCCYNSPLSRIIQEQLHHTGKQSKLKLKWGSAKHPICNGISITDLQKVNWENVDLSEWTGILTETGVLGHGDDFNLDALTKNKYATTGLNAQQKNKSIYERC